MLHNNISTFFNIFPFEIFESWEIVIWPIHWNSNHWILFIADNCSRKSFLLDPLSSILDENQIKFQTKITKLINKLNNIFDSDNYSEIKIDKIVTHPLQSNSFDCGPFICQYSLDYISSAPNYKFNIPNAEEIRKIISNLNLHKPVIINNKININPPSNRKDNTVSDTKDIRSEHQTNPLLSELTCDLKSHKINLTCALDKIMGLFKSKKKQSYLKSPLNIYDSKHKAKECVIREMFNTKPKKAIEEIIGHSDTTSYPSRTVIENHFRSTTIPTIDFTDAPNLPSFPETYLSDPIVTAEIKYAMTNSSNSAAGSDDIKYSDWKEIDPKFEFLSFFFNFILETGLIPDQWRTFKTLLVIKPNKEEFSSDISSWRPIAILDTSYRLFTRILNRRMLD